MCRHPDDKVTLADGFTRIFYIVIVPIGPEAHIREKMVLVFSHVFRDLNIYAVLCIGGRDEFGFKRGL